MAEIYSLKGAGRSTVSLTPFLSSSHSSRSRRHSYQLSKDLTTTKKSPNRQHWKYQGKKSQEKGQENRKREGGRFRAAPTAELAQSLQPLGFTPSLRTSSCVSRLGSAGGSSVFFALEPQLVASWPVSQCRHCWADLALVWGAARSDEPSVVF